MKVKAKRFPERSVLFLLLKSLPHRVNVIRNEYHVHITLVDNLRCYPLKCLRLNGNVLVKFLLGFKKNVWWQPSEDCKDHCNVPLQLKRALHAMKDQHQPAPHCDFLECLHHNHISYHIQHDADEVFHVILNLIEQQMSDPSLAAEIQNLYKITVDGQIHCLDCTYVHHVPTFFLSLPLHLRGERNTLEECIRSFFEVQTLEDTESFYCDRCEKKQPTSQGFHIVSLPSILCIHLKRFRSENGFTRKLKCKVTFPESFDMADVLREHQETIKGKYSLYAVVMHSGFATSGHYTAYVHCKQDKTWYYTNDNKVQQDCIYAAVQERDSGRVFRMKFQSL
ncbi:hypothetical protein NFI96_015800 [Prochilodus magdalenae]|nr:hypothetical protein NFI96_015800 [Prochilodus magdalenae]